MEEYLDLAREVTIRSSTLFQQYEAQIRCRRGCYYCCEEISVLPIEIEAVRIWLTGPGADILNRLNETARADNGLPQPRDEGRISVDRTPAGTLRPGVVSGNESGINSHIPTPTTRCTMLDDEGDCLVYPTRPLICRTHGLPLAYRVYEYDENGLPVGEDDPEYMDLWCDMNFTGIKEKDATSYFDANGRLNMDEVNIRLGELNDLFIKTAAGRRYAGHDRLPMKWLLLPP